MPVVERDRNSVHEDVFHLGADLERVPVDHDQVRDFPLLQGSEVGLQPEELRGNQGDRADRGVRWQPVTDRVPCLVREEP